MVENIEIKLENGKTEKLRFDNYALRLLSRVVNDGKAKSVEETFKQIQSVVEKFQQVTNSNDAYSALDSICIDLIPIVACASNSYKDYADLPQDTTLEKAEKIMNRIDINDIGVLLSAAVSSVVAQGLPKEDKKKVAVKGKDVKPIPRGKK